MAINTRDLSKLNSICQNEYIKSGCWKSIKLKKKFKQSTIYYEYICKSPLVGISY